MNIKCFACLINIFTFKENYKNKCKIRYFLLKLFIYVQNCFIAIKEKIIFIYFVYIQQKIFFS